jgi:hypothetical protein
VRKLDPTVWIVEEALTEIGCFVVHGYWKVREGARALLGGGLGAC